MSLLHHKSAAAIARIQAARYTTPYPEARVLVSVEGGPDFVLLRASEVAEACLSVADREEFLSIVAPFEGL